MCSTHNREPKSPTGAKSFINPTILIIRTWGYRQAPAVLHMDMGPGAGDADDDDADDQQLREDPLFQDAFGLLCQRRSNGRGGGGGGRGRGGHRGRGRGRGRLAVEEVEVAEGDADAVEVAEGHADVEVPPEDPDDFGFGDLEDDRVHEVYDVADILAEHRELLEIDLAAQIALDDGAAAAQPAAAAAGAPGAPPSPPLPSPADPPPPERPWREDAKGYVFVPGRALRIGRITSWGSSVSAKCFIEGHGNRCARPYSIRQLPNHEVLGEWLVAGLGLGSCEAHMGLPKKSKKKS